MSAYYVIIMTLLYIFYYLFGKNGYWKKRNVPHLKATPIFGNYKEYILLKKIMPQVALHPVLGVITREVMEDYTLPSGLHLEKGLRIHIPVLHLHHNPDNFPHPEKFYPERFLDDEKKNIKPFTYLPFGEGPRICIGLRFSKMAMIAGLITVFKNYRVKLADGMSRKLDFEPTVIVVSVARGGIHLKFMPRTAG